MISKLPVIFTTFESLEDPRSEGRNKQHDLLDIIFITLSATIAGCDCWTEVAQFARERIDWFRKFIPLKNGIPSHDTIGRVLSALDTASFQACLLEWVNRLCLDMRGQGIQIDGKTLRRSFDAASNRQALHVVSAWCNGLSVCLGQVATDEKSNEITAVPMLLELLNIDGAVVTLDAMNCQRKTVAKICDKGADYVITVKRNQKKLHKAIREEFERLGEDNFRSSRCRSHRTTRKTRGRIEERTVTVAPVPRALKETAAWANLKTIGMVYRHREEDPKSRINSPIPETDHVTYFISSLPTRAKTISKYVREHWTVENKLHWTLDVTFTEDSSRIRKGSGPEVMAAIRRTALSILKRDTSMPKRSLRLKRKTAGWSPDALEAIIRGLETDS